MSILFCAFLFLIACFKVLVLLLVSLTDSIYLVRVVVSTDCQCDRIYHHVGDKPPGMAVEALSVRLVSGHAYERLSSLD